MTIQTFTTGETSTTRRAETIGLDTDEFSGFDITVATEVLTVRLDSSGWPTDLSQLIPITLTQDARGGRRIRWAPGITVAPTVAIDEDPNAETELKAFTADGRNWVIYPGDVTDPGGGGASALADLTDVDDALAPANGDFLVYTDAGGGAWVNDTLDAIVSNLDIGLSPGVIALDDNTPANAPLSHGNRLVVLTGAAISPGVILAPNATVAFPIGTVLWYAAYDSGATHTITPGVGVNIFGPETVVDPVDEFITLTGFSSVKLVKMATNSWFAFDAVIYTP